MSNNKPTSIPKCNCGMVSAWIYDDMYREWYQTICFRCLEIKAMKGDKWAKMILPMDTNQVDRFIELMIDDTVLTSVTRVSKFQFGGK